MHADYADPDVLKGTQISQIRQIYIMMLCKLSTQI